MKNTQKQSLNRFKELLKTFFSYGNITPRHNYCAMILHQYKYIMENKITVSVLNELLHITNDRIEGFEKVEGKVWEKYPDIKAEYDRMISQSKMMKNELINQIKELGGEADDSTSMAGSIHRTWIDIKNSFTIGNIEDSTLANVVFGEKAAVEAYENALESGKLLPESVDLITEQLHSLKVSYKQFQKIEEYRNG